MMSSFGVIVKEVVSNEYIRKFSSFIFNVTSDKILILSSGEIESFFMMEESEFIKAGYDKCIYCTIIYLEGDVFLQLNFNNSIPKEVDFFYIKNRINHWSKLNGNFFYIEDINTPWYEDVYIEISKFDIKKKILLEDKENNIRFIDI